MCYRRSYVCSGCKCEFLRSVIPCLLKGGITDQETLLEHTYARGSSVLGSLTQPLPISEYPNHECAVCRGDDTAIKFVPVPRLTYGATMSYAEIPQSKSDKSKKKYRWVELTPRQEAELKQRMAKKEQAQALKDEVEIQKIIARRREQRRRTEEADQQRPQALLDLVNLFNIREAARVHETKLERARIEEARRSRAQTLKQTSRNEDGSLVVEQACQRASTEGTSSSSDTDHAPPPKASRRSKRQTSVEGTSQTSAFKEHQQTVDKSANPAKRQSALKSTTKPKGKAKRASRAKKVRFAK